MARFLTTYLFIALLVSPVFLYTQDESFLRRAFNMAEGFEAVDDFVGSLELFSQLVEADPENPNYNFRLANAIIETKSHRDPLPHLKIAASAVDNRKYRANFKNRFAPDLTWFLIAKEYHRTMQFNSAIDAYTKCLEFIPERNIPLIDEIKGYIRNCQSGVELKKNPVKVKHLDFPPLLIADKYAHSPLFSPDESVFIFTVPDMPASEFASEEGATPQADDNLYTMELKNGRWTKPQLLSENINSSRKEASVGISPDGKTLIVYRDDMGVGNLYYSELEGKTWSRLKKFPAPINSASQETHATLSADGNTLYFTSDRRGGFGGMDIYMSQKDDRGRWGAAVNLGPEINTQWHEESPHLQAYSNILYFSSNRPESMGGFDIFRCELEDGKKAKNIINLGYPINTAYNDLFFKTTNNGKKGYFSSNCKSSYGQFDLSIVEFLDIKLFPNVTILGIVIDADNDTLRNSKVYLFDIAEKGVTDSTNTAPASGKFSFDLNSERQYFASFEHKGWIYFSKPFQIEKYFTNNSFSNFIELDPIILDDSSMRQNIGDFIKLRGDMARKQNNQAGDYSFADAIFEQIVSQKSVSFTKANASLNPLARKMNEPERLAGLKGARNAIPELARVTDFDMPLIVIDTTVRQQGDQFDKNRLMADSLMALGMDKFQTESYIDAIEYLEQALNIYEDLGLGPEMAAAANFLGRSYSSSGRHDEAIHPHLFALSVTRQLGNIADIGDKEYEVGIAYDNLYNKTNALSYLVSSKIIRENIGDLDGEIESESSIADVHEKHSEYQEMLVSLRSLLVLANEKDDPALIASVLNRIGLAYNHLAQYNTAIGYFNRSIAQLEGLGDSQSLSVYLNNIGNSFFAQGDYSSALEYYQRSLDMKRDIDFMPGEALTLHNMGNTYFKLLNSDAALQMFDASMNMSLRLEDMELIARNHFSMMQVHQYLQQYDKALWHYEKFMALKAPVQPGSDTQLAEAAAKYEISQKDLVLLRRKIARQELLSSLEMSKRNQELQLIQHKNKKANQLRSIFAGSIAGLVLLVLLFTRNLRTKQKLNAQLKSKNEHILAQQHHITAQKDELLKIHGQLEKLSIVASETANAVSIFDSKGNFEWVNQAFIDIYGKNAEQLNTKEELSIFNIHSDRYSEEIITDALQRKEPVNFEAIKHLSTGAHIWMNSSLTPIFDNGQLVKIIVIDSDVNSLKEAEKEIMLQRDEIKKQRDEIEQHRDIALGQKDEIEEQALVLQETISELQNTQRKLIEAEKMASLGNLVAGIAHEINTPVGIGIAAASSFGSKTKNLETMFAERTMKQSDLAVYFGSAKEATQLLKTNLNRTADLVKSFKQVSVDEITEQSRAFNLNDYIADVLRSLEPKLSEKTLDIKLDCPGDLIMKSYPGAFAQILTNFAVNSIAHGFKGCEGGTIEIKVKKIDGGSISLSFADNGNGMEENTRLRCFDPFFTTNMQLGTGLGLNIVYNLVNQKLKGEVSCISQPKQGAEFIVVVPQDVMAGQPA
jgi:PAS domain S-box-containing protein